MLIFSIVVSKLINVSDFEYYYKLFPTWYSAIVTRYFSNSYFLLLSTHNDCYYYANPYPQEKPLFYVIFAFAFVWICRFSFVYHFMREQVKYPRLPSKKNDIVSDQHFSLWGYGCRMSGNQRCDFLVYRIISFGVHLCVELYPRIVTFCD